MEAGVAVIAVRSIPQLPSDVLLQIFCHLDRNHLYRMMRVCQLWQTCARAHTFWTNDAKILHLNDDSSTLISKAINQLIIKAGQINPDQSIPWHMDTVVWRKKIIGAFKAMLVLCKLGIIRLEKVESFAEGCHKMHQYIFPWCILAKVHMVDGKWDQALTIVNCHLIGKKESYGWKVIEKGISIYLEDNLIQKAIDLASIHNAKTLETCLSVQCAQKIFSCAYKNRNFLMMEKSIAELEVNSWTWKIESIICLIEAHRVDNGQTQACKVFEKYRDHLNHYTSDLKSAKQETIFALIHLYVNLQKDPLARELSAKYQAATRVNSLAVLNAALYPKM